MPVGWHAANVANENDGGPMKRAADPTLSIYRTIDDAPQSEISTYPLGGTRSRARRLEPALKDASYAHMRVAEPATEPLPTTFKWIARLPAHLRPYELLRQHPRVANALAADWGDPQAFHARLDDLLVDKRGNRRGFPDDVCVELLALRSYVRLMCLEQPRLRTRA
jgi:hypothetical protein